MNFPEVPKVLAGKHISRARCRRSATGKKGECSLTGPSLFFGTMQGLCCRVFDRDQRDRTDNGAQQRIARSGLAAIESGSALRPLDSFPVRTVFQSIQRTGESTKPKARPSIGGPARARSRGRARKNPIPAREFVYPRHLNATSTPRSPDQRCACISGPREVILVEVIAGREWTEVVSESGVKSYGRWSKGATQNESARRGGSKSLAAPEINPASTPWGSSPKTN